MTYNRTAKEDLVGAGMLLPEHAPPEFEDRAVLWNSVEKNEKAKNAQLARSLKYSLPNEWDEATARQVMECFIKEHAMMQEKISMKVDTSAIEQEIAAHEKQLRQSYSVKARLMEEIDSLDPDDKHYIKRKADLDDRLYKMYDKIEDTENQLKLQSLRKI